MIDDLHLVTEERCHRLLAELVASAPPNLRFVLAGRGDPPLPVGSLRAAGRLAEIHEAELRFTAAEVADYVRGAGLELPEGQVEILRAKTEGWPAALQLAVIWLRRSDNPASAIRQFAGDHQHVVDYPQ